MSDTRFILSKSKTIEQYNKLKSIADEVSYSVKTNIEIAKILEESTDSKFSVHFLNLSDNIKDKSRVTFLAQGWSEAFIHKLIDLGVKSFVVDNEEDLNTLLSFLNHVNNPELKIDLLLRMRFKELSIHTGKHYVFGIYSDVVNRWIPKLRKNNHINKLGVHFHRKTQNTNEWQLIDEVSESLNEETLSSVDMINIGGGLPVKYKNYPLNLVESVFKRIERFKEFLHERNIRLIVEPGRFIAAPPVVLETKIKQIIGRTIIVDASIFNSAMDTFIADTRLLVDGELGEGSIDNLYLIKGCTPDSRDIFRYRVYLKNPKKGEFIRFINAGDYNFSTDICKLKKPETIIVD